jgi:hypothetical protein
MNGVPNTGSPAEDTGAARNDDPLKAFVEHQRKALEETGKALDALLPDGFKEHSAEARREFVKGMKVLVDAALSELERASREFERGFNRGAGAGAPPAPPSGEERPPTTGANKVKVQVD